MIIDAHAHVFPPSIIARRDEIVTAEPAFAEIYANPDARMATADDVLASMDAAGVDPVARAADPVRRDVDERRRAPRRRRCRRGGRRRDGRRGPLEDPAARRGR